MLPYLSVSLLLTVCAAQARISEPKILEPKIIETPQPLIQDTLMKYDYNLDSKITEKEFLVMDGDSTYREHLANLHRTLGIEYKDHIKLSGYWAIELSNPAKYKKDLSDYFQILDHNRDGIISTQDYINTFASEYVSGLGTRFAQAIDDNHDNLITYKEYTDFDFTALSLQGRATFRRFDTDQNYIITVDELLRYFQKALQY